MVELHYTLLFVLLLVFPSYPQIIQNNCPNNSSGLILSGSISLKTSQSSGSLVFNQESLIYNYSLSTPFYTQPEIALSLSSMQSQASPYLMISVKSLPMSSDSSLSFLLRLYYKYSSWSMISFFFLAEDRTDIQASYYEIDTRQLATNTSGKAIQILLPFSKSFQQPTVIYFLNGFEIASITDSTNNNNSPFQIQVTSQNYSGAGVFLVISATTSTEILSLLVSYIVYQTAQTQFYSGIYQYSSLSTANFLSLPITTNNPSSFTFLGLAGFIMPNSQGNVQIGADIINSTLSMTFSPAVNYINYQYFGLYEPKTSCFYCQNAPYKYINSCIAACPIGTNLIDGQCLECSVSQYWNGSMCLNRCLGGRIWVVASQSCQCPGTLNWNGATCISCVNGLVWNATTSKCNCPINQYISQGVCLNILTCPSSQTFDITTGACICPPSLNWNGSICLNCTGGQIWSVNSCVCPSSLSWNGSFCSNCSSNLQWSLSANQCICPINSSYNGFQCITCSGGMIFDQINLKCVCPSNSIWNGQTCITLCQSPLIYINGECLCPQGTYSNQGSCQPIPNCPNGTIWLASTCQNISCSVGMYWNGSACVLTTNCPTSTYWNGLTCISYTIQCPNGSLWNGTYCIPSSQQCPAGTYISSGQCTAFPQQCLSNYIWNGSVCLLVGLNTNSSCSNGSYYNGINCVAISCVNGQQWNSSLLQCVCLNNSYWNGQSCIQCPSGQIYVSSSCGCPPGYFLIESICYTIQQIYCTFVANSQWNGTNCICNPGFVVVGMNCACNGLIIGQTCNVCYTITNSELVNGVCQCISGYYMNLGKCLAFPTTNTNISQNGKTLSCQPGTLADLTHSICIPCSDGCLSCLTNKICLQCRPEYNYNWATYTCDQICGDGKRFTLSCDDGNNRNSDGCSADCHLQSGYTCYGGSPNSPDFCTIFKPAQIIINQTGTTHLFGKIVVNVRTNYLPSNLTNPSVPCISICQQILKVSISSGFNYYTSITSQLISTSSYSFAVTVEFGVEPIGVFTLSVGINPTIGALYFSGVDFSQSFDFIVNPAYLSMYTPEALLN